jgi:chromate reductase
MHILAINGSLRAGSNNRKLLNAVLGQLPANVKAEIFDLHRIPLYDGDVEAAGLPDTVLEFRDRIHAADGLLIAVPEYNYSIGGVLKNAIDWASRPPQQPFAGKPVGIISTSSGLYGGVRAQSHIRQVLQYLECVPMPKPELIVPRGQEKFDAEGNLTDEKTLQAVENFVPAFIGWMERMK